MAVGADPAGGRERLIATALVVFGARGIAATSLRTVAAEAGVSPALVVHHFRSKAGLCEAVDREVAALFQAAYEQAGDETLAARSMATVALMRERPDVYAYLGRGLVEGSPASSELFRRVFGHSLAEMERLSDAQALSPGIDQTWAALQHVLLLLGPLMLRSPFEAVLGTDLLGDEGLHRWARANERLLRHGIYLGQEDEDGTLGS
jgi:TetR/AcrR family transcriptional regulator, regulator of cefoperazone and chloramphenicol sensitivity